MPDIEHVIVKAVFSTVLQRNKITTCDASHYAAASNGKETGQLKYFMGEIFGHSNVFSTIINPKSITGTKGLSNVLYENLANVGQEVVTISGKLQKPINVGGVIISDHVFNGIRDSNGKWKVVDVQTGNEYSNEFIDSVFQYLNVFEAVIDNNN